MSRDILRLSEKHLLLLKHIKMWRYLWLAVVFLTTVFYVFVMVKLYGQRKVKPFDGSYFTLWRHLGIADVLCVTGMYVFQKVCLIA